MVEDKGVIRQVEELSDKAAKYDHLKNRYVLVANKLKEAAIIINEVMNEIDPLVGKNINRSSVGRSPRSDIKEMLEELYKRLQVGFSLTMEDMEKQYPNPSKDTLKYIFYTKLAHAPRVLKRKDGTKLILYMQKEV